MEGEWGGDEGRFPRTRVAQSLLYRAQGAVAEAFAARSGTLPGEKVGKLARAAAVEVPCSRDQPAGPVAIT